MSTMTNWYVMKRGGVWDTQRILDLSDPYFAWKEKIGPFRRAQAEAEAKRMRAEAFSRVEAK